MPNPELRSILASILEEQVDLVLARSNFKRRKGSMHYVRRGSDVTQKLMFNIRSPRYSDDTSIAHVSGTIAFCLDGISNALELLLGGDLQNYPGNEPLTMAFNIGLLGPMDAFESWRPESVEDVRNIGSEIASFVGKHVLPFFERYNNLADIANGCTDGKFPRDDGTMLQFAAASLTIGDKLRCKELIEDRFDANKRLRKRYSAAIEVANSLGE